jgi:UDP-glucose 4-epimerase
LSNTYQKYFITGGAGFIGSHLSERLLNEGDQVTVFDSFTSGHHQNIQHLLEKPGFKLVQSDLLNAATLTAAMRGHDVVWHLAANTDIRKGNEIIDLDLRNCTIGTLNILEAMRQNGIDKLLFASSATVYGDTPGVSLSETFGPLLPISLYGAGKLACEGLISAYNHLFGIQAWMFRFANVVGAHMDHGVIFDFIQKLRRNPAELEILGDGRQEKPYFLVEDCIDGMLAAFNRSKTPCDVYNLGCESFTRVTRVAEIITEEMGLKNVTYRYTGGQRGWPGDVPVVHYDVSKMKKLGWQAKHTSDKAVREATERLVKETL